MTATRRASLSGFCVLFAFFCAGGAACSETTGGGDNFIIYITATGAGSGRVWATEPYIDCHFAAGRYSQASLPPDHNCHGGLFDAGGGGGFDVHARPDSGSVLTGWTGDCTGNPCRVSFDAGEHSAYVTVRFDLEEQAPNIIMADSFDVGDRWQRRIVSSEGVVSDVADNASTGGTTGGFRRMQHRIDGVGALRVFHRYTGAVYQPSVSGAIDRIHYSEQRILIDPPFMGAGVASGFALEQGGQLYTLNFGGYANTSWQAFERSGITAADFTPAPGPDFTSSGAEIRFGYLRANSNTSPNVQQISHGIDNWRVEIVRR